MTNQKLVDELENALTDEAYDGGMGAMSPEEFRELVRTLAVTAAEVFEKAHTPTDEYPDAEGLAALRSNAAEPQGEPSDAPKRLVYEVNMLLSSVASHGPAALTDTSDRMYTPGLLRRLRDAIYPKPAQRLAAGNAVRAEMARNSLDVHRMVYGQEIANVLASAALDASLRAVTEQGEAVDR